MNIVEIKNLVHSLNMVFVCVVIVITVYSCAEKPQHELDRLKIEQLKREQELGPHTLELWATTPEGIKIYRGCDGNCVYIAVSCTSCMSTYDVSISR